MSMSVIWLVAVVVFAAFEATTVGLTSIWFALGALAALIAELLDAALWLQITLFLVVSALTLYFTRPLVKKYVNGKVQPTNADALIGKECKVTENIDNLNGTGAVYVDGKTWTARSDDDEVIEVGQTVIAERIEGVKLIVAKAAETAALNN